MRIDSLAFKGIGPFVQEYRIDFSQLGTDALFLIEGPTGAGKSTILDAITYGIYGEPAAANSDIGRMRSNHLSDSEKSWVEIVFTTRNATFRVTRSPEYQREKSRGGGQTTEKPTLLVEKLDGSDKFRPIHESVREGNTYLQNQVGLDRNQFAQTVLLPQGQFDKFLKSDTKERQPLLEKIFRTQKFTKIMELLNKKSKESASAQEALKQELRECLSALGGAADLDLDIVNELNNLSESANQDKELLERIQQLHDIASTTLSELERELHGTNEKYSAAEGILNQRKLERNAEVQFDGAKTEFDEVNKQNSDAISALKKEFKSVFQDLGIDTKSLSSNLSTEKTAALKVSNALESSVKLEDDFESLSADYEAKNEEITRIKDGLEEQELWFKTAPKSLIEVKAKLKLALKSANSLDGLTLKRMPIQAELDSLESLALLKAQLSPLQIRFDEAKVKALGLVEKHDYLMKQRLANAAGQFASELTPGEPCQVCGSTSHPKKAKIAGSLVSDKDLETAAKAARAATEEVALIKGELETLSKNIKLATSKASKTKASILKELQGIDKEISQAEAAIQLASDLQAEDDELSEQIESVKGQIAEYREQLAAKTTEARELKSKIEKSKAQIERDKGQYDSVVERQEAIDGLISEIEDLDDLIVSVEQARGALAAAKTELSKLPKHKDFGRENDAASLLETLKPVRDTAVSLVSSQKLRVKSFVEGTKKVTEIQKRRSKLISGSADLINLAKLANGDNPAKQNLPTYVLQSMFEDVLVAANSRFENVLEGRYRFEASEIQGSMAKKQGLGLSIHDQRRNKSLNPTALSGGESFCAALSLALGLSDVVRANQGGIAIDTFFIDEGFGSLDPTRLNQVISVLTQLKMEGRTIGLISHVEEMKEAIQEKIEVRPVEQSGPSTLTVNWMQ